MVLMHMLDYKWSALLLVISADASVAGLPGQESGNALVDVLYGVVDPRVRAWSPPA